MKVSLQNQHEEAKLFFARHFEKLKNLKPEDAIKKCLEAFPLIQNAFKNADVNLFLEKSKQFLQEFKDNKQLLHFYFDVLSNLFGANHHQEVLATDVAKSHLGRALFLLDNFPAKLEIIPADIVWTDFKKISAYLEAETVQILQNVYNNEHPEKTDRVDDTVEKNFFYDALTRTSENLNETYENLYASTVSELLVRPDGRLNSFLLADCERNLLSQGQKTAFDKNIHEVFVQLSENERLQTIVESGKIPDPGSIGDFVVRGTCLIKKGTPIHQRDVQVTTLSALFSRWRQRDYGSCHSVALAQTMKDVSLEKVAEECNELIFRSSLTRTINGKVHPFFTTLKLTPYFIHKPLQFSPFVQHALYPEKSAQILSKELFDIPHLKYAFELLGADLAKVEQAILKISKASTVTIYEILNALKQPERDREFQEALFYAQAAKEMPLLRIWETAITGMMYPPFSETNALLHPQFYFKRTLEKIIKFHIGAALEIDLSKLRYIASPPDDPKIHDVQISLHVQDEQGNFRKINNEEEFGELLKNLFSEAFKNKGLPNPFEKYSNEKISKEFQLLYRMIFAEKSRSLLPTEAHETPWNFDALTGLEVFDTYLKEPVGIEPFSLSKEIAPSLAQFFSWAEKGRINFGIDPDVTIIASNPTHTFRLTPNHPSMFVKKPYDTWAKDHETFCKNVTLSQCGELEKDILDWAMKEIPESNKEKFREEMQQFLAQKKEATLLPDFLNAIAQKLPSRKVKDFDAISTQMLKKNKELSSHLFVQFADTNWDFDQERASLPVYFSFFCHPRTLQWQIVSMTEDGSHLKTHSVKEFQKLYFMKNLPSLMQQFGNKQLLALSHTTRQKMLTLKNQFFEHWKEVENCKKALKKEERSLFDAAFEQRTLKGIAEHVHIFLDKKYASNVQAYATALEKALKKKMEYHQALDEIFLKQTPVVDKLLQPVFVTHFEASSSLIEALDADILHLKQILKK